MGSLQDVWARQIADQPPSQGMMAPFMLLASSLSRYVMVAARSLGLGRGGDVCL